MDPLDFRLRNYAEVEPITGKPYSSKALRECYAEGAERFGWSGRPLAAPTDARRRGLARRLGHGDGGASTARCSQAEARAVLRVTEPALVETSAIDMGQGALTALAQIAADSLGLDIDQIEFRAGSSDLPDGGIAGGSGHTATAGSAIDAAGSDADRAARAPRHRRSGLAALRRRQCRRGRAWRTPAPSDDESRSESYAEILARAGLRRSRAGAKALEIRPRWETMRCKPTARSSPR